MFDLGAKLIGIEHTSLLDDAAIGSHKEGRRHVDQADRIHEISEVVTVELVCDTATGGKALHFFDRVLGVYSDESHDIAHLSMHLSKVRELFDTRRAAGVPKVDHERPTKERRRGDHIPVPIAKVHDRKKVTFNVGVCKFIVWKRDDSGGESSVDVIVTAALSGKHDGKSHDQQHGNGKRADKQSWTGDLHSWKGSDSKSTALVGLRNLPLQNSISCLLGLRIRQMS